MNKNELLILSAIILQKTEIMLQDGFYINSDGIADRTDQMNEINEYTCCVICGSEFASHYKTVKAAYSHDCFKLEKCKRCNLILVNPRLNEKFRNFCYRNESHVVDWHLKRKKESRLVANTILDLLAGKACQKGDLLEIGCGIGTLMETASERGFSSVTGIELNKHLASHAKKKGFNIIEGDFYKLTLAPSSFDVIVMDQVLEHMGEPLTVLIKARELLKPGGYIFVGIPEVDWLKLFLNLKFVPWKSNKPLWSPEDHLFYFKQSTLIKLIEKAGFRYIDISNSLLRWRIKKLLGLSSGRFLGQK